MFLGFSTNENKYRQKNTEESNFQALSSGYNARIMRENSIKVYNKQITDEKAKGDTFCYLSKVQNTNASSSSSCSSSNITIKSNSNFKAWNISSKVLYHPSDDDVDESSNDPKIQTARSSEEEMKKWAYSRNFLSLSQVSCFYLTNNLFCYFYKSFF